ncbi:MAG: NCS2 family permease, partial [Calditrichia bacterium]|nr:NCS2 family permease [Calditrichia bacterium]
INAISPNMKNAMAVGIGLFITFIGFQNAGLIVTSASIIETPGGAILNPGTLLKLTPNIISIDLIIFFLTLILTAVLHVRKIKGSILIGIISATLISIILKSVLLLAPESWSQLSVFQDSKLISHFSLATGIISAPPSISPTFFKFDLIGALSGSMIPFIVIFLFMDMFDTIGTLIGVSERAGFIKDNKLPRANKALLSDAVGTVAGASLGTSTVTSFIESAAGVEQGGRTGLTGLTTALLFLLALFFSPVISMIGSYSAITAPALVIVGAMMMQNVVQIKWNDFSESIPAFLTIISMPLTYSIADGIAIGFVCYPLIKFFSGKGKNVSWLMYVLSFILILYFIFLRT